MEVCSFSQLGEENGSLLVQSVRRLEVCSFSQLGEEIGSLLVRTVRRGDWKFARSVS